MTVRAFAQRMDEAALVALLRGRAAYTPDLSLVAEIDGRIVGHALFTPVTLRLLDVDLRAALLAPLTVDPPHQRQGIGAALLDAGHAAARAAGCALALLLGHPTYYPRFGYQTFAFGASSLTVDAAALAPASFETRPPVEADLPALMTLWRLEEDAVDFAVVPDTGLTEWLSPNPHVAARVWLRDGVPVGYTRTAADKPAEPRLFLAADHATARAIAAQLAAAAGTPQLTLPLHPLSHSAAAFSGTPTVTAWEAAMVCPLAPSPFDDYRAQVTAGARSPGRPLWSTAFDLV